jgi:hypothetical protein
LRPRITRFAVLALAALLAAALTVVATSALAAGGPTAERLSARKASKPVYDRQWKHNVSAKNKRWARRVARCESGRDPNALGAGGRYRGAFQFRRSTWKHAPRSPGGDPIRFSYRTQSFIAVRVKERDGKDAWPSCG